MGKHEKQFQCCSKFHNIENEPGPGFVTWCANPEGGDCSDGANHNCQGTLACGLACDYDSIKCENPKKPFISGPYKCCADYALKGVIATCNIDSPPKCAYDCKTGFGDDKIVPVINVQMMNVTPKKEILGNGGRR